MLKWFYFKYTFVEYLFGLTQNDLPWIVINDAEILPHSWKKSTFVINFTESSFGLLNYSMVAKVTVHSTAVISIYQNTTELASST